MKQKNKLKITLLSFWIVLILIIFLISYEFHIFSYDNLITLINTSGIFAPIIFITLMALAIIVSPIPSMPLASISGVIFGTYLGTLYSVLGATFGAVIAFLIARYIGRDYIIEKFGKKSLFLEKYNENKLAYIIFIMRLFPFFQFDIVSYGAGLTKMRTYKFTIASILGMIPMTYIFVKSGDLLVTNKYIGIIFMIIVILGIYVFAKYGKKITK